MPRDFSTYNPLLRSPPISISRRSNHVSIKDEKYTSVISMASPAELRLVKNAVIFFIFRKSTRRSNIVLTSVWFSPNTNALIGSRTTT